MIPPMVIGIRWLATSVHLAVLPDVAPVTSTPHVTAFASRAIQSTRRYDMPRGGGGTLQQASLMFRIRNR